MNECAPFRVISTVRTIGRCIPLLALIARAPGVMAQQSEPRDSTSRATLPLFTRDDAYLGGFFIAATAALAPFDRHIALELEKPGSQASHVVQNLSTDVRLIADPGSVIIGAGMYITGRLAHQPKLADLGLHGEEAIVVSAILGTAIKWTTGRARPYVVADSNARDYQFLRGLRKGNAYSSFPSGHVMAAFSAAAAVSNEAARWWPQSRWYVGTAMYTGATAVAFSRMYNDKHWASDVILGAGIGTFAGNKVVRYHHRTNPSNRLDRWLLGLTVMPTPRGDLAIGWSLGDR